MRTTSELKRDLIDGRVVFHDYAPDEEDFEAAVLAGLAATPKAIPCRFLYDERGSRLFEQICEQPEYYPTRTETGILQRAAPEIAALAGPDAQLIELGSGASKKVRLLLDAMAAPAGYVPIDVSREQLKAAARRIGLERPMLDVHAICADYLQSFALPSLGGRGRRLAFFPGSTIGNLERDEAYDFLSTWSRRLGCGSAMVVGVDLKKPADVLHRAYDDAAGVTAAFSKNLLVRANRELGADFDTDAFRHEALWSDAKGCVEIHLRCLARQTVRIGARAFAFEAGEGLHVENSHKYEAAEFQALAERAGFTARACWTDPQGLFSVHYLDVADPAPAGGQARSQSPGSGGSS